MEDRRIRKTKKNLKDTLVELLMEVPFEQISITELCRRADVSRIIGTADYHRRQEENNPNRDLVIGYLNVLDSILAIYYDRFEFFQHTNPDRNPYLAFAFYNIVLDTVELHTSRIKKTDLELKYSPRKIAGFVCFGLLGFINECHKTKTPLNKIKIETRGLLADILKSEVVVKKRPID